MDNKPIFPSTNLKVYIFIYYILSRRHFQKMDQNWPLVLTVEMHKKYLKRLLNHKIPVGSLDANRYK